MAEAIFSIHGALGLHFFEWVFLCAFAVSLAIMLAGLFWRNPHDH